MKLKYFKINNYRNLDKVEIYLHDSMNFLVGENDLGKSNFLDLLDILFLKRSFIEKDFFDIDNKIAIEFKIKLENCEIGAFDDLFSAEDEAEGNLTVNILAEQNTPEDDLEFLHKETGCVIPFSRFRALNYMKNSSVSLSNSDFDVHKNKGAGKFLNYLIKKFIEDKDNLDFISKIKHNKNTKKLIKYTSENLNKIDFLTQFEISTDLEGDVRDLLCRMLEIKAHKRNIQDSGHGIQYSFMIILFILEKIINIYNYKNNADRICKEDNGTNSLSLILSLDEPEIHQHPYMQRSLIKSIKNIIENKNENFLKLLKEHFDISKINGQIIIVTHSPNILLDDYKNIVRFYKDHSLIKTKNGERIKLEPKKEKHLLMNFGFFKEAFFSRGIIIVEGKTEEGLIPKCAELLGIDFDDLGISLISADGADSIKPIIFLCKKFGIPYMALFDKDKQAQYSQIDSAIFTNKLDIEADIVDTLIKNKGLDFVKNILISNKANSIPVDIIKEKIKKYKYRGVKFPVNIGNQVKYSDLENYDANLIKVYFLSWLLGSKTIIDARKLAENFDLTIIPPKIKSIIKSIKSKVS